MQIEECRRAFYAGAMACYGAMMGAMDGTDDDALAALRKIHVELMNLPSDLNEKIKP